MSPSSGTVRSRSAPARTGTFPPADSSWRMLIVPPVNATTTRDTRGRSARRGSISAAATVAAGVVPRIEVGVDLQVDRPGVFVGADRLPVADPPTRRPGRRGGSRGGVASDLGQATSTRVEEVLRTRDLGAKRLDERIGPVADARPRVTLDRSQRAAQID